MRREFYEADPEAFPADAYAVKGFNGIACHVLGWETEPDEDTEWSGYEARTGRVIVRMVGDDGLYAVDPEDCTPITAEMYCGGCGQIGCACG